MRKNLLLTLWAMILSAVTVTAAPVDSTLAKQLAVTFYNLKNPGLDHRVELQIPYTVNWQAATRSGNAETNSFYIINIGREGFVIVAADDRVTPILGYSTESVFNADNIPANVANWLYGYKEEIKSIVNNRGEASAEVLAQWQALRRHTLYNTRTVVVPPLIQTRWNQGRYYNHLCPTDAAGSDGHVYTGCVATAMAQVIRYWEHPSQGKGSHSYNCEGYGTQTVNFAGTAYDFANMPVSLSNSSSSAEINAVATLMYHCGVSVDMEYGADGSGADMSDVPEALQSYFGYTSSWLYEENSHVYSFSGLIETELLAGRPVIMRGSGTGGHCFICDGYDNSLLYHFNWGWGGYCDGYFTISQLNPGGNNFNSEKAMLVGLKPVASAPATTDGQPCVGRPTVTDYDGNVYNTVQIGSLCWMKENLKTYHYADGTAIPVNQPASDTIRSIYYPNNDVSNVAHYGCQYNWSAYMKETTPIVNSPGPTQGVCPNGWHIPSNSEWRTLFSYTRQFSAYNCGDSIGNNAKSLAAATDWSSSTKHCAVGNAPTANNSTNFTILPAGVNEGSLTYTAWFATRTLCPSSHIPFIISISNNDSIATTTSYLHPKYYSVSVRCVCDSSPSLASVTTDNVSAITTTSAVCGGNVTSDGNLSVTARGICWSTSSNPTLSDAHTTNGTDTGAFVSTLTGLQSNTTYYVRAYVTNGMGTEYGLQKGFTTTNANDGQPCNGMATATDYDGNTYNTVQIGTQCWMKENLKTTKYADNTSIPQGSDTSSTTAYWYYPNNNASNKATYGLLYNWKAVMRDSESSSANPSGVQGICPTGWHVPSNAEWTQLTDYVSSQSQYQCNSSSTNIAKALASNTGWGSSTNTCAVGNTPSTNNATGFSAVPAGCYCGNYGSFGYLAYFWSATQYSSNGAYYRYLRCDIAGVRSSSINKYYAYSVRCLRDTVSCQTYDLHFADTACQGEPYSGYGFNIPADSTMTAGTYVETMRASSLQGCDSVRTLTLTINPCTTVPTVTTSSVSAIATTTATCGGNVTNDGGATVTARGVCWSTSQNPTVADSHTSDSTGTGNFISSITGLTANTIYYVRAYATNSVGTAYGEEVSFTTTTATPVDAQPCPGVPTVTDIDSNVYNTVQIGNQCWMKENLKTTRYSDGTAIPLGNGNSYITAYRYYPDNNSNNVSTYGYLYNWSAAMGHYSSSSSNPSGVQGVCPTGWHLPSKSEWEQLVTFVRDQNQYRCGNSYDAIAKALSSTIGWVNSTNDCAVGNNQNNNNATGFSALPAGHGDGVGSFAGFWSAYGSSDNAFYLYLHNTSNIIPNYGLMFDKTNALSIRCLHNEGGSTTTLPIIRFSITSVDSTTATCESFVEYDGGSLVTARGVNWGVSMYPDNNTNNGTGTGAFTTIITGLTPGIIYYVRAYATNSMGTAYGEWESFSLANPNDAQPCTDQPTATDYDGNIYNTVQLGDQCWMKENLRTTHYANGSSIYLGSDTSTTTPYRYYPNNDSSKVLDYGYLYNRKSIIETVTSSVTDSNNIQNICPTGWHLPSYSEWNRLTDYVNSQYQYRCDNINGSIAKALATTSGWRSNSRDCSPGYNSINNNSTGFSAAPAGFYNLRYSSFNHLACFWNNTENIYGIEYREISSSNNEIVNSGGSTSTLGAAYSVRCIRNASLPVVTTTLVSEITATAATCGGNVTNDGGATVTARGVCWSTSQNPTVADSHTSDGTGSGSFSRRITGLSANTVYYVRAYATNSAGTAYGNEVSFTSSVAQSFTCGISTVTDHEGNVYNTIQMGRKCWTRENIRTKTSPQTGTNIVVAQNTNSTTAGKQAYWPNNDSINAIAKGLGLLYNWYAAVDTFNTNYGETYITNNSDGAIEANFSTFRRGICPTGWHLPSPSEWYSVYDYVMINSFPDSSLLSLYAFPCGNSAFNDYIATNTDIAAMLAANEDWTVDNRFYRSPMDYANPYHHVSGFNILPTEYQSVRYWTCMQSGCNGRFTQEFNGTHSGVAVYSRPGAYFYSVRCVKDMDRSTPSVTTLQVTDIGENSAKVHCMMESDGGGYLPVIGVCWNTSANPVITGSQFKKNSGAHDYCHPYYELTSLQPNTTYYVRSFAICDIDTVYGNVISFHTSSIPFNTLDAQPCPNMPTVTDIDGNIYHTVHIGSQCWMKENMRTTRYADGTSIALHTGNTEGSTTPIRKVPYEDTTTIATLGYLYNWPAVMNGATSSNTTPSCVQGLCPDGWHIPSLTEWNALTNYVMCQSEYVCSEDPTSIVKALADTLLWHTSSNGCAIGNNLSANNATGFSLLPSSMMLNERNFRTRLWTTTIGWSSSYAYMLEFTSYNPTLSKPLTDIGYTLSVRCLHNECSLDSVTVYDTLCSGQDYIFGNRTLNSAGTYRQTFQNAAGCDSVVTLHLSIVPSPSIQLTGELTACLNGHTFVTATGGIHYRWSTGDTTTTVNLPAGVFEVTVSAANGCTSTRHFNITLNNQCQSCALTPTLTDHQGNVYNTVQIGTQCWTKENMRCTTSPSTGTTILEASPSSYSYSGKKAYYVNGSSSNTATYGLLYNWCAAVDTFNTALGETSTSTTSRNAPNVTFSGNRRGICPAGWHIPSNAEWTQLTNYVSSQSQYQCNSSSTNIAKALASTTGWNSNTTTCAVGNTPCTNNATGFSAVPAGYYTGGYNYFGYGAYFWSATQNNSGYYAYSRYLYYNNAGVGSYNYGKYNAYSVRCLRDTVSCQTYNLLFADTICQGEPYSGYGFNIPADSTMTAGTYVETMRASSLQGCDSVRTLTLTINPCTTVPTVTTSSVSAIATTTATCGGNVTNDGGATVTARGVCWSTSQTPTVANSKTTDGTGTGSFTSSITGLTANTTYYVRAYATNSVGTAYGNEISFTTASDQSFTCGTSTIKDHQGNVYNTVPIGTQCWTKENMRCTTSPNTGTTILESTPFSYTYSGKKAYYVNGDSSNTTTYGLLYNWCAAVDTFNTALGETSTSTAIIDAPNVTFTGNRRGICPAGWHIPSNAEWTQLTNYVSSQSQYQCNSSSTNIAKALASTTGWNSSTATCAVGNTPSTNNATGFSAVPAGNYGGYGYGDFGSYAYFWSATQSYSYSAYYRALGYSNAGVYYGGGSNKNLGYAVRCLCDENIEATLSITGDSLICENSSATLTAHSNVAGTYTWSNGLTGNTIQATPGVYTVTLTSSDGTSVTSSPFTVTAIQPANTEISVYSYGSYTFGGQTYTQSGDYIWTGTASNGCDSIVTLHLQVGPEWIVNPHDFELSMNITGQLLIDDTLQLDTNDALAAFVNDTCVGVARPVLLSSPVNSYITFMTIYGNRNGTSLDFKLYDASEQTIYDPVEVSYNNAPFAISFTHNAIYGTPTHPVLFNGTNKITQDIPVEAGWNWISTNVFDDSPSLFDQFEMQINNNGQMLKSQTQYSQYDSGTWLGNLTTITNTDGYMLRVTAPQTLSFTGYPVDPLQSARSLMPGWSWIGYVPQSAMPLTTALNYWNAVDGEAIKSQTRYAQYVAGIGWLGNLTQMQPGQMYKLYSAHNTANTFRYPANVRGTYSLQDELPVFAHWSPAAQLHPNTMTVTLRAQVGEAPVQHDRFEVSAFNGNDCRGATTLRYEPALNEYLGYLTIHGEADEWLTFKGYDAERITEYPHAEQAFAFIPDAMCGTPVQPVTITFASPNNIADYSDNALTVYPNPTSGKVTIQDEKGEMRKVKVYDVYGRLLQVMEVQGDVATVDLSPFAAGVYTLRVCTEKGETVAKVVKR